MTFEIKIFDHDALARNRAREVGDLFLHDEAITEVQERLNVVNKTFTKMAIVTGAPQKWANAFPNAVIVNDDEVLDLAPNSFDLVVHAMALHWANDPVGQLVQCRLALIPDGLLIAAFMGGETLHELRASLAEAEIALTDGLSPRVAPMGEIRELGGLLQRAGFALPVADRIPLTVGYNTAFHLMHDLRAMGETNALMDRDKTFTSRNLMTTMAATYAENFSDPEGRIIATYELIFLTGWSPDESQQKPLRPGSASARLADALNTTEFDANTSVPNLSEKKND